MPSFFTVLCLMLLTLEEDNIGKLPGFYIMPSTCLPVDLAAHGFCDVHFLKQG